MSTRESRLPAFLPEGGTLPDDVWRTRHIGIVCLVWVHAAIIPIFGVVRGYDALHVLIESLVVPAAAAVASLPHLQRRVRTAAASLGLLFSSGVLVHLSGGVIEMHFHFFVMVAVVALYQDWVPFLAAIAFVFLHHGLLGVLDPDSVFNHGAARDRPWVWAGIHAFFISGISVACLVTWRLNERMLDERRRAEARLRRESSIVESLHAVGETVAAELDTQRVVQAVTDAATELTNAAFGAFFYNVVDQDGESYMLYSLSGAPMEAFAGFGLPRNTEIFAPTFAGVGVVRIDDVIQDPRYGKLAPHFGMPKGHPAVRSYLAVPVRSRTGEVLGGLLFGHPEPAQFSDTDERIVVGIASQAAVALDNARLYESEREARASAEEARDALTLLAAATRVLTSSLELDLILRGFADLIVAAVADYCAVDVVEEDGTLRRIAVVANRDLPFTQPDVGGDPPQLDNVLHPVVVALRTGKSQVVTAASTSAVVSPLNGRSATLGTLSLATADASGRRFDDDDVAFVEELARRAAIAIENAQLYDRQRTVAATLQHSLLPERLPDVPGIATAARYIAGADVEVGGDWYDVVPLPGGRLALTMGDVVGRGEGAASRMGQLRNAVRAYALDGKPPAAIVSRLNSLLLEMGPEQMATMVYAVLDHERSQLHVVNAGHPPPLLLSRDGTATFLEEGSGMPLGAAATARYHETTVAMTPGDTVILYTDGLVEDRHEPLQAGLDRLRRAVQEGPRHPDALCDHVLQQTVAERRVQDDTAILAVCLLELGDRLHLRLPAEPAALSSVRSVLRRWLAGAGASEQESFELVVATVEACSNVIRHAAGPSASHFEVDAVMNGHVEISVRDHGTWREHRPSEGGRGLVIIEDFVDDLQVLRRDSGTEVRMRRRLLASPAVTL